MDLKKKLGRLSGAGLGGKGPPAPPVSTPTAPARNELAPAGGDGEKIRRDLAQLTPKSPAVSTARASAPKKGPLPAEQRESPWGTLFVRDQLYEETHRHGFAEVRAALEAEPALVSALALDPSFRGVDPRGMLLMDTETTGLAGGTGTLPFVVGLGWFEGPRLRVQQLVLRRPGEETPILREFESRLAQASCLVTYNGKTFDWPLLRNRFVMNRLKVPAPRPHLDLLHCARRVFRHREGGAKLTHLEEHVLGHVRVDDVPGEQIPELYFRYLRSGNGALIGPVLDHNAQDMVLLAALLGVLVRQFRSASAADPRDQLGYARVALRAGDEDRALAFAHAASSAEDRLLCAEALAMAADVARRRGEVQGAIAALQRAVEVASGKLLASVHLELAKLYEHRAGDLARALDHARHTLAAEGADAHRRRLERLERRLARSGQDDTLPLRLE